MWVAISKQTNLRMELPLPPLRQYCRSLPEDPTSRNQTGAVTNFFASLVYFAAGQRIRRDTPVHLVDDESQPCRP